MPLYYHKRGLKSIAKTSTEVKNRWNEKTYKRIMVSLRREDDAELIEWFEKNKDRYGPTEIFRAGIDQLKNKG